jgi:hypothetical protein
LKKLARPGDALGILGRIFPPAMDVEDELGRRRRIAGNVVPAATHG